MDEAKMESRVAVIEANLENHVKACEDKHERVFRLQLVIVGAVLTALLANLGVIIVALK